MTRSPDVLVVGGGIIGLTSAYALAKAGATVAVYDRGDLGMEASWAGAGIIPPGDPDHATDPLDKLRAIASVRLPAFSAELRERTGIDNGYLRTGGVEFLTPDDEYAVDLWRSEGVAFERLTTEHLYALEPSVREQPGTPYHLPGMAQVRNPWHLRALIAACSRMNVDLHPGAAVERFETSGSRVAGVRLADGSVRTAGAYLLAAGAWADGLLAGLGCRIGIHPVRGQIILFDNPSPRPRRILLVGKRYLVPRGDGRVLVGSTEEPEAAYEKRVTDPGVGSLLDFIDSLLSRFKGKVHAAWAGLRPGSPDGRPFIGPVPGYPNVVAAVGHFRAGIQLSLGTADLVADLLLGRLPTVPADAFRLDRRPDPTARPAFRS